MKAWHRHLRPITIGYLGDCLMVRINSFIVHCQATSMGNSTRHPVPSGRNLMSFQEVYEETKFYT